jgi:hypothetical protein
MGLKSSRAGRNEEPPRSKIEKQWFPGFEQTLEGRVFKRQLALGQGFPARQVGVALPGSSRHGVQFQVFFLIV